MDPYTLRMDPTIIDYLRKQDNASEFIRQAIEKEIAYRKSLEETPAQKVLRLNREIGEITHKIAVLEERCWQQTKISVEKKAEFEKMFQELTIIQDAYEKEDAERIVRTIPPRGYYVPFFGDLCIRFPGDFKDEKFKETVKETLDRMIKLKKILDAFCVEIDQLKEKKAALEREMMICQV